MTYRWDRGTRNAAIIFVLVVLFLIVAAIVGAYV
jgi:hypothetical protein